MAPVRSHQSSAASFSLQATHNAIAVCYAIHTIAHAHKGP